MGKVNELYELACKTPSQINELLPTLYGYASMCEHVTEFGVETVISTYALLMGAKGKVISYDVNFHLNFNVCMKAAMADGFSWEYKVANVLGVEIEETDMLFIDTLHTERQLKNELRLHAHKVRRFLAFHDTITFWEKAEMPEERGLKYAIEPFLQSNPEWTEVFRTNKNNGLLILERCQK